MAYITSMKHDWYRFIPSQEFSNEVGHNSQHAKILRTC